MVNFPREMFNYNVSEMTFTPDAGTVNAVHSNGRASTVSAIYDGGFGLSVTVEPLDDAEHIGWKAWFASLGGGAKSFLAYDLRQSVPYAYRGGLPLVEGVEWDGECSLVDAPEIGAAALTGLPVGCLLTAGDYIGFEEGVGAARKYAMSLLSESVTADGSGEATVSFSPALPAALFTDAATVNFVEVKGKFIIPLSAVPVGSSVDMPSFSFEAMQVY